MRNKVWKKLFMGSLMISAMAVPTQTAVRIQAEEETAALAENETDFQMLFDEAVKDAMIIDADVSFRWQVLPRDSHMQSMMRREESFFIRFISIRTAIRTVRM